jgi:RND family efflux transporter MFP subunit
MADQLSADLASLRIQRDENPEAKGARRSRLALGCLVLLALAAVYPAWRALSAMAFKTEVEVTEIRMVSPAQASIQVTSTGYVVAGRESKVGARLLGRVAEVLVRQGDPVKTGDVLVRLDDAEARMAIAASRARALAARARVQSANASIDEARRQFERERGLAAQGAALPSVVQDLESKVAVLEQTSKAAAADAAALEAETRQLELNLEFLTVTAPIDGVVTNKPVATGELVGPASAPVLELADFGTLVVETDVPETRLSLVQKGGPAEIVLDAYPSVRHRGRVVEISPRVNRAKATVVVKVAFVDAIEGVLPDMSARVSFLNGELDAEAVKEPPKLFVPASAIVDRGGEKVVFRLDEGKAREERITLGTEMAGGYELTAGPGDGTRVIANPPSQIADGYPVKERTR